MCIRDRNKTQGYFVLVERGGCTFETKIKQAERFGAEVLLISDYPEGYESIDFADLAEDLQEPAGQGVLLHHIPAFEIDYEDSQYLLDAIKGGEMVYLQATMDTSNIDNTVEVDLWYSTSLDLGELINDELSAMSISFN